MSLVVPRAGEREKTMVESWAVCLAAWRDEKMVVWRVAC